jgi:diguanylate cyclase (GGDEF)-like protein
MSWRELPDLFSVGLLIYAFVAVARPAGSTMTRLWLRGWICIEIHFAAYSFLALPGAWGAAADAIGTAALIWCAQLFCWSMDPEPRHWSSRLMFWSRALVYTFYICLADWPGVPAPPRMVVATLLALVPLTIFYVLPSAQRTTTRLTTVVLDIALAVALLFCEMLPATLGVQTATMLCAAYLYCCIQCWFMLKARTGGFIVTFVGLLTWAAVFPMGLLTDLWLPKVEFDVEMWNLPKFLVAVGMIMLLLENQLKQNQHLADHDELTGLPNRRLFESRLGAALSRAQQKGVRVAVLAIDLDGFKSINDRFGHRAGDLALQDVAHRFAGCVQSGDTLARTGGDEFSLLLECPMNRDAAVSIAKCLQDSLMAPAKVSGEQVQLGASIGIALFPEDAGTLDQLCSLADQRMYAAKRDAQLLAQTA